MNIIWRLLTFCWLTVLCLPSAAYIEKDMRKLTISDGLPNNTIQRILRTPDAMMWFGTLNGLARYDGVGIRSFALPDPSNQKVSGLSNDPSTPYIWIWSGNLQLSCFDTRVEAFTPLFGASLQGAYSVKTVGDSLAWIAFPRTIWRARLVRLVVGLGVMVIPEACFALPLNPDEQLVATHADSIDGAYWLSTTQNRLLRIAPHSDTLYSHTLQIKKTKNHPKAYIHQIKRVGNSLWLTTNGAGVVRYFSDNGSSVQIGLPDCGARVKLSNTTVFDVGQIDSTTYILTTWNGYSRLNYPTHTQTAQTSCTITNYSNNYSPTHQSAESRIRSVYIDQDQVLWLGTAGGGVLISNIGEQFFDQWHQTQSNATESMLFDKKKRLWFSTYNEGVMRSVNAVVNQFPKHFNNVLSSTQYSTMPLPYSLRLDQQENVWAVGPQGRMVRFNIATDRKDEYQVKLKNGTTPLLISAYFEKDSTLWLGCEGSGVLRLEWPYTDPAQQIWAGGSAYDVQLSPKGELWCATSRGVLRIDPKGKRAPVCYGPRSSALTLNLNPNGYIYAGTTSGLLEIDPQATSDAPWGRVVYYNAKHGLSDSFVAVAISGNDDELWLGSDAGISRFSLSQKICYNYYFQGNNRSGARSSDGTIFWGNNKSIACFNPSNRLTYYRHAAKRPVAITELKMGNRSVGVGDTIGGQILLNQSMRCTSHLRIGPQNNHFSFHLSNLLFNPSHERYEYRLLPLNDDWTQLTGNERVSFSALPAGRYTFEARSQALFPGIERPVTRLTIEIEPYWFASTWFRILLLFSALGSVVVFILRLRVSYRRRLHFSRMRAQIESSRSELNNERQRLNQRVEFFNYTAHELRTPLTLVLSPAQELMADTTLPGTAHEKLKMIENNASVLLDQVSYMLHHYQPDSNTNDAICRPVDLQGLVLRTIESLTPLTESKEILITSSVAEDPTPEWVIECDEQKITSALTNLLTNSIKYRREKVQTHIEIALQIVERDARRYVVISIADNGQGIAPERLPTIFSPYAMDQSNTSIPHTKVGLGLSIVRTIAQQHNGWVEVKSSVNQGSLFMFALPYLPSSLSLEGSTQGPTSSKVQQVETILVVENHEQLRHYLVSLFNKEYRVLQATTGTEGLCLAIETTPDLVLHALVFPAGPDGIECCATLSQNPATAHIPVVLISDLTTQDKVLEAASVGAIDYVIKPFHPRVLKAKIEAILRTRRLLRRMLHNDQPHEQGEQRLMNRLVHTIESHLTDPAFGVDLLARKMGVSTSTLRRMIKNLGATSVADLIRDVRLTRAASLLMDQTCRVVEAAELVGYNDLSTFRTQFTRKFGISPSRFHARKQQF